MSYSDGKGHIRISQRIRVILRVRKFSVIVFPLLNEIKVLERLSMEFLELSFIGHTV